jgi:hypothetical protein
MSAERTDQYPEVSGEDAGIVPPQGAAKTEWPKKIRTLTASELDRLTIDGLGRFYWDGKLVNYEAHPSRIEKPVDLDQHAMDLLDRTARELSDPNSTEPATGTVSQSEAGSTTAPELAATPSDALAPVSSAAPAPTTSPSPVVEVRRQELLVPAAARTETVRVKLSMWQSFGLVIVILGFLIGAAGFAASGFVAAHDWGCKVGMLKSYCPPPPPPAPKAPARPDIPA